MKILSFDLECNQPGAKIIELGWCIGDTNTRELIDIQSIIVNPKERLLPKIVEMTGITQKDVDNGVSSVAEAYLKMEEAAKKYGCLTTPIQWGAGDGFELRYQMLGSHNYIADRITNNQDSTLMWNFGGREIDVKAVYQSYQIAIGSKFKGGLMVATKALGLNFLGIPHRAKADATNTFLVYCELLARYRDTQSEQLKTSIATNRNLYQELKKSLKEAGALKKEISFILKPKEHLSPKDLFYTSNIDFDDSNIHKDKNLG
jgi:inhibitor of KinA sporulation pathway (predicted exonuclease)